MTGSLRSNAKVVVRLPPNEPVLTAQGVPAMSWLYFFQALGLAADQAVASDLPQLVDQMLLDLVPLPTHTPLADVLPELMVPQVVQEVLPELAAPVLPITDQLEAPAPTALTSALSQRITDLELWSL